MQNLFEGEWLNFNYDLIRQSASERERERRRKRMRVTHTVCSYLDFEMMDFDYVLFMKLV